MRNVTLAALVAACSVAAAERPNIVFILADDLGARDLSNEGSTFYESPHIDRIAAMGKVRFSLRRPWMKRLPLTIPLLAKRSVIKQASRLQGIPALAQK